MTVIIAQPNTFSPDFFTRSFRVPACVQTLRQAAAAGAHKVANFGPALVDCVSRPSAHRGAVEGWTCVAFSVAGILLHQVLA